MFEQKAYTLTPVQQTPQILNSLFFNNSTCSGTFQASVLVILKWYPKREKGFFWDHATKKPKTIRDLLFNHTVAFLSLEAEQGKKLLIGRIHNSTLSRDKKWNNDTLFVF